MSAGGAYGKILVVDTNLFFVKRLTEALRLQGFEVLHSTEPAYALTMIEWNMPVAILCAVHLRNAQSFDIPSILRADAKTRHISVIGIGDRGQQSQLLALRAGYDDFLDRRLSAEEIAAHLVSFLTSHQDGFQPTQMLGRSETALDGRLSLVDLPGMIQVLAQSRQTGALHVNATATDGVIFFDAGEVIHAESGQFAGDEAIAHLIKNCYGVKDGVYKFIPGGAVTLRTVQGNLSGLILDALRELDEEHSDPTARAETQPAPKAEGLGPKLESDDQSTADARVEIRANPPRLAEQREPDVDQEAGGPALPSLAAHQGSSAQESNLPDELRGRECDPVFDTPFPPEQIEGMPEIASDELHQPIEVNPATVEGPDIFGLPKELDLATENENNPIRDLFKDFIEEAVGNKESHE